MDNKKRYFYSLSEITPFVPCEAHKEWLNEKQGATNVVSSLPFIGAALDITDIADLNDKWIGDTEMKISNLNEVAQLNLVYDPEKGIFYFDENELYKIKEVKVTFCKCDHFSFALNDVIDTITFPEAIINKDFLQVDEKSLSKFF
ncbi:MAG: hypothetical protein U9532_03830 ['Conium maculatum' witches'-broom phytoplasma]|nr:hypothetical protein ['Conium maculatum' witches'-broom phytoplasma]